MLEEYEKSRPQGLVHGGYHLPYVQDEDWDDFKLLDLKKISVARCARVSYLTHDGAKDAKKDLDLYTKLAESPGMLSRPINLADPMHASPLEHVATPCPTGLTDLVLSYHIHRGNFVGWDQMRHEVEDSIYWNSYS